MGGHWFIFINHYLNLKKRRVKMKARVVKEAAFATGLRNVDLRIVVFAVICMMGSSFGQWTRTAPKVYLSTSSDSVGIGTSSPLYKLEVLTNYSGIENVPLMLHNNNSSTNTAVSLGFEAVSGNTITGKITNVRVGSGDYRMDFCNYSTSLKTAMSIYNGGVGIGTTNPNSMYMLDVETSTRGRAIYGANSSSGGVGVQGYVSGGNNGYGVYGSCDGAGYGVYAVGNMGGVALYASVTNGNGIAGDFYGDLRTSGTLTANAVTTTSVKINNWTIEAPDYVFDKDYKLRPLSAVEKFIAQNNHLPGIASAKEMKQKGVDLAKMNMDLLKKVEELTLYVITQNKKIENLEKKIAENK
jgi:hypothetical protein